MAIRVAFRRLFLFTTSGLALSLVAPAHTQAQVTLEELVEGSDQLETVPGARVVPLTSRFFLNGTMLEYGTTGFADIGAFDGSRRNAVPIVDFSYAFGSEIDEGIDSDENGALYWRNHTGWYGQLRTVTRENTITTTRKEAGNLNGFRVRLSVAGTCLPEITGNDADELCTYTPGLTFNEDSLDPNLLIPTEGITDSIFGQVISQETYEALQQPGWQRGVEGGDEVVGLDIDVPNAGFTAVEERSDRNSVERTEHTETRAMFSVSRVDQNLYTNSSHATVDNTTRGFVLLNDDEWTSEAIAMQLAAWLLPSVDARLPGAAGVPNLNVSNNLFYAANNLRLPLGSFTAFQTGAGRVEHPTKPVRSIEDTPVAWYNSFWMGFSPVRDISVRSHLSYETTGPRIWIEEEFAEGGFGEDIDLSGLDDITGGITVVDELEGVLTDIDFADFESLDLWTQLGAGVSSQEAIQRLTTEEVSDYRYVPHLSFSGNRTDGNSVLRYYTGILVDDDSNAYIGADYTLDTPAGWSAYARADLYSNPDRDYYSELEGRLSKSIGLETPGRELTFGVAGIAELDRPDVFGNVPRLGDGGNQLDLLSEYRHDNFAFTLRQRFSDIDDGDSSASTTVGASWLVTPQLSLAAQVTPVSDEDSYIEARAGLNWRLQEDLNAPTLRMQWAQINYDYSDSLGNRLESDEQTFLAALQVRF